MHVINFKNYLVYVNAQFLRFTKNHFQQQKIVTDITKEIRFLKSKRTKISLTFVSINYV